MNPFQFFARIPRFSIACLTAAFSIFSCSSTPIASAHVPVKVNLPVDGQIPQPVTGKRHIRVALLLDTSNSMDGLIDQAKAQLWEFVNALSNTLIGGEVPSLQIALYEYGNDHLNGKEGFIRQVSPFTGELDVVSEKLFALRTNGGNEFCGQVIQTSIKQLNWSENQDDVQVIFIAGNEEFTQGGVSFQSACADAREKRVVVNAIFCGGFEEGIDQYWQKGAEAGGGNYMSIEQDRKTVFIETPYDAQISVLNDRFNTTYMYYGAHGQEKKNNQEVQDENAASYGESNKAMRSMSKASSFYWNSSWDLVDASKEKEFDVTKLQSNELPTELRGKSSAELLVLIQQKSKEREEIRQLILQANALRTEYISANSDTPVDQQTLSASMIRAIQKQVKAMPEMTIESGN